MHWCMDETLAVLAMLPVIGFLFSKLHVWWHKRFHHKCHEKGCHDTHVEHCHMPANIPHGKVGEGQCEQHPLVIHDEGPEPEEYFSINDHGWGAGVKSEWDAITQETVEARFGAELVQDLRGTLKGRAGLINLEDHEVCWYINEQRELKAEIRGRQFIHGWNQCEHGWDEVEDDTGKCCQGLGQE